MHASKGTGGVTVGETLQFQGDRSAVRVTIAARTAEALEASAHEIEEATGSPASALVADFTTPGGRAALLAACPEPTSL